MTEEKRISELLERYWEGETTLSEEQALKNYFNAGKIYSSHREYTAYFTAVRKEQQVKSPVRSHVSRTVRYWLYAASLAVLLTAGWWIQWSPEEDTLAVADSARGIPLETPTGFTEQTAIPVIQAKKKLPAKNRKPERTRPVAATVDPETQEAVMHVKAALALVSSSIRKTRREVSKGAGHLEAIDIFHKKKGR
jgi:hypothetical protein